MTASTIPSCTDLGCHRYVLLLGVSVVLVDIQHDDSVGQSERSIRIHKRFANRLLQSQPEIVIIRFTLLNFIKYLLDRRNKHGHNADKKVRYLYNCLFIFTTAKQNNTNYIIPFACTLVNKKSIFPRTIIVWNTLQHAITNSTNVPQLKQALLSTPTY